MSKAEQVKDQLVKWLQHEGVQYTNRPRTYSHKLHTFYSRGEVQLARIIDTFGKKIEHVRFVGIDTPELHDSKSGVAQCYAKEARDEALRLLNHKTIDMERDPLTRNRDVYGRYLRVLKIGTLSISDHLIQNGFARVYTRSPASAFDRLKKLQEDAKKARKGLWKSCVK